MPILKNNRFVLSQTDIEEIENDAAFLLEASDITNPAIPILSVIKTNLPSSRLYYSGNMPDDMKGYSIYGNDVCDIFINLNYPKSCCRFTLAHEFGHLLRDESGLRLDKEENENPIIYWKEKRADYFAACLLMPGKMIRGFWKHCQSIEKMTGFFSVSRQAMIIRLKQLKLLPYDVAEQLLLPYKRMGIKGWIKI